MTEIGANGRDVLVKILWLSSWQPKPTFAARSRMISKKSVPPTPPLPTRVKKVETTGQQQHENTQKGWAVFRFGFAVMMQMNPTKRSQCS